MDRHQSVSNGAPHFLAMMVRAPRAADLLANSGLSLRLRLKAGPAALSREGKFPNLEAWRQPWQALKRIRQQ
jgi:hypothetical protein